MNELKLWWIKTFKIITIAEARRLGLKYKENIYGDMSNRLNCRSIWIDNKNREYKISQVCTNLINS